MQTLGAFDSSGVTGTTGCTEGTHLVHTGKSVSVSVAASFLFALHTSLTEAGDRNTLALTLI